MICFRKKNWATALLAGLLATASTLTGAETVCHSATFVRHGAEFGGYYAPESSGSVQLLMEPCTQHTTEPLALTHLALHGGDSITTEVVRDCSTTFSYTFEISAQTPGTHYLVLRRPLMREVKWTYYIRRPADNPPPSEQVASSTLASEFEDLVVRKLDLFFDEDTSGTWLGDNPDADFHWVREDLYYAVALLGKGTSESAGRANVILQAISATQDRQTTSPTYGHFYTNNSNLQVADSSATHFVTPILAWLLLHRSDQLSSATREAVRQALGPAAHRLRQNPDYPRYTNFSLNSIAAQALAGKLFNDDLLLDSARLRLQEHYDHAIPTGAPMEGNSPVYSGVSQWALKLLVQDAPDTATQARARLLQQRLWIDTAAHYHPELRQSAGPYGRTYSDGLRGGAGLTNLMLATELQETGFASPGRVAEMVDALHSLDLHPAFFMTQLPPSIPPELAPVFKQRALPLQARQKTLLYDATTFLSPAFALGTMDASVNLGQNEGYVLQVTEAEAPGGWSPMVARTVSGDDKPLDFASGREWGTNALQRDSRAIVFNHHRLPSSAQPASLVRFALVADERFRSWEDLRLDGAPVTTPAEFPAGSTLFARRSGVYLAVQALYAGPTGPRHRTGLISRQNGHLGIALHTVDAETTVPVAGHLVEAGFAVYATEAGDWPDYDSFISSYLANSQIDLQESATTRSISWSWPGHGQLELDFDRQQGSYLSRRIDGSPLSDPMLECEFAQQTTDGSLSIRDLAVSGLPPYSWAVYPVGAEYALLTNVGSVPASVTCNWSIAPIVLQPYESRRVDRGALSQVSAWFAY